MPDHPASLRLIAALVPLLAVGPGVEAGQRSAELASRRSGWERPRALPAPAGGSLGSLAAGDLDGDGVPDLVVGQTTDRGGRLLVYRGDVRAVYPGRGDVPALPFSADPVVSEVSGSPDLLAVGDFDRDGRPDVVCATRGAEELLFLPGLGDLRFGEPRQLSGLAARGTAPLAPRQRAFSAPVTALAALDLNRRDGLPDLVVGLGGERPRLLVLESPEGAIDAAAEELDLPSPPLRIVSTRETSGLGGAEILLEGESMLLVGRDRDLGVERARPRAGHAVLQRLETARRELVEAPAGVPPDGLLATLEMRLNRDALPDLVVLRRGSPRPELWLSSPAATLTVDSTASWSDCNPGDGLCVGEIAAACTGPCTLKAALQEANASAGADTIQFNIPGGGDPVIVLGSDFVFTSPVTLDGTTQPGGKVVLQGSITLDGGSSVARGLVIQLGTSHGVRLRTLGGDIVEGCLLGTDPTGFFGGASNGSGVRIEGVSGNLVGGTVAAARNILSGNVGAGVHVTGSGASGNLVQGNYIGTTVEGTSPIPNTTGVFLESAGAGNVIGGTAAGAGNLISGNGLGTGALNQGIVVQGSSGTLIQGNTIGANVRGDAYLGNTDSGIVLQGPDVTIGGTSTSARNLVSGNGFYGIVAESTATGLLVRGNWVGPAASGLSPLANGRAGIRLLGASGSVIGGDVAGAGNVIGGNAQSGILIEFGVASPSDITIQGNNIGLNVPGNSFLTNRGDGVRITSGGGVTVGGSGPLARNVVSGNERHGVFGGAGTLDVRGNYVGTDVTGSFALANLGDGIRYESATAAGTVEGNVASGNVGAGISIKDGSVAVKGNLVGVDASGTALAPNGGHGILVGTNRLATVIGGTAPGEANVVAHNGGAGVRIEGPTPIGAGVPVRGNALFLNAGLAIDLATGGVGGNTANDPCDADGGANQQQNFPVLVSVVTSTSPAGPTRLKGSLESTALRSYTVDVYSSEICGGPGFSDLRTWLGSGVVETEDTCLGTFDLTLPAGALPTQYLLVTATSAAGDTSEASACLAPRLWGDLDVDGDVDLLDLLTAANLIVGNITAGTPPFSADVVSSDVNQDGVVDVADLIVFQAYLVGNLGSLPL